MVIFFYALIYKAQVVPKGGSLVFSFKPGNCLSSLITVRPPLCNLLYTYLTAYYYEELLLIDERRRPLQCFKNEFWLVKTEHQRAGLN